VVRSSTDSIGVTHLACGLYLNDHRLAHRPTPDELPPTTTKVGWVGRREPVQHPEARSTLDFAQPVAILLIAVLHFPP
jgi:hypothetical protein